jgi:hypothetical protein
MCQWRCGHGVADMGIAKCTFRNVTTLSTSPLGHVAYWPRLNTWINRQQRGMNPRSPVATWIQIHVADCGHVDLDHIATVEHVAHDHVARFGHVAKFAQFFFFFF